MGPVTTEVFALRGRGACFKAPLGTSISKAYRPAIRSSVAILASYFCIRSTVYTSSSRTRDSNLLIQIRISCREILCRCDSACSVSPKVNSSAFCRLNTALCRRYFAAAVSAVVLKRAQRLCRPLLPPLRAVG